MPSKLTRNRNGEKHCSLRFLLSVMSNEDNELPVRVDAAKAIMPYQHRKKPVDVDANINFTGTLKLKW